LNSEADIGEWIERKGKPIEEILRLLLQTFKVRDPHIAFALKTLKTLKLETVVTGYPTSP